VSDLDGLIPHAGHSLLLERVLPGDETLARAELVVREGPWLRAGALAPEALVEALAQTAAAFAALEARRRGVAATGGVLAAVSHFAFPARATPGETVTLEVRLETVLGPLAAFEGRASVGEREVARGELRVAVSP
jgi:predicted hotdog family 3-hydroxylacyl-ACP dehydratase